MDIHIGKEIERVYRESGMKLSEFARRINTSSRNIYSIFERREIKTDQLRRIGEVLGFDFFSYYKNSPYEVEKYSVLKAHDLTVPYRKTTNSELEKIVVMVELDGTEDTLERHVRRITTINRLLTKVDP